MAVHGRILVISCPVEPGPMSMPTPLNRSLASVALLQSSVGPVQLVSRCIGDDHFVQAQLTEKQFIKILKYFLSILRLMVLITVKEK